MEVYVSDVEHIAATVAWYKLQNWMSSHPEHEGDFTLLSKLYRRACLPYAMVKVVKRLEARGYTIDDFVSGDRSEPRPSIQRRKDIFLRNLQFTIERASERICH